MKRFPIQDGPSIPWEAIAPYERQAYDNHEQSLKRLAERGGLGAAELYFIMTNTKLRFHNVNWDEEEIKGLELIDKINKEYNEQNQEIISLREEIKRLKKINEQKNK